jgi:hypothetical protein
MSQDMERTMGDLREYVARRLRDSLHGKEIDLLQPVEPRLQHMLGLTSIGEVSAPEDIDGSILDSGHEFWGEYYKEVRTRNRAREEVTTAIESLRADSLFRKSYPYGEEGGIVYVEVEDPDQYSVMDYDGNNSIRTPCRECGDTLRTAPRLVLYNGYYHLKFSITCDECGFDGSYSCKLFDNGKKS